MIVTIDCKHLVIDSDARFDNGDRGFYIQVVFRCGSCMTKYELQDMTTTDHWLSTKVLKCPVCGELSFMFSDIEDDIARLVKQAAELDVDIVI